MTQLLIVDDQAISIAGYRELLKRETYIAQVADAANKEQLFALLAEAKWDLMLFDIQIRSTDGIELLRTVCDAHPEVRVLVVTGLPEEIYFEKVLQAGAFGYLSKSSSADKIAAALRRILAGHRYFHDSAFQLSRRQIIAGGALTHETLSSREMQVFRMIGMGMKLTHIGNLLHLSVKTIGTYRARIMEKMQLKNNAEIVRYIVRHQI